MRRRPLNTAESPQKSADASDLGGHGAKSEAVRERAILALLSEKTLGQAAAKAEVNERTLRRWLSEDLAFQAAYAEARQATFQAGINRAQVLTVKAIDTLDELLDEKKHPHVRLGAARTVAELGIHQHDAETILKKLGEIEAYQGQHRR